MNSSEQRATNSEPFKTRLIVLGFALFAFRFSLPSAAQAFTISNVTFSNTNITYETGGVPNGTTVSFTIDSPGLVQMAVNCGIQNLGDTGTNVAILSQTFTAPPYQLFWNGLWLIGGDLARTATNCDFTLTLSSNSSSSSVSPSTLVTLNSIDIHNVSITPSLTSSGGATPPYSISYALAKDANVSLSIANSSGTVVSTSSLISQAGEKTISTHTVTWNGLEPSGQPAPLGVYTLTINAADPAVLNSNAIPRTRTFVIQSLAGVATDPQKLFEDNVFVYPNPVRNGLGTIQMEAIRDGANLSLKIYTISGTLVFEQTFPGVAASTVITFPWKAVNQSGNKLGRGLYYYVVREDDATGTLQTVKKMAVLP